jgi:anti-sigma B factor antagonist
MALPLRVHVNRGDDGSSVLELAGELDLSTIARMEAPLLEQVRQRPAVVVDLSQLSFIDSSGIGVLIKAFQTANGTRMNVVIGRGSQVERVFRIAGIGHVLPVYFERDEALAAVAGGRSGSSGD